MAGSNDRSSSFISGLNHYEGPVEPFPQVDRVVTGVVACGLMGDEGYLVRTLTREEMFGLWEARLRALREQVDEAQTGLRKALAERDKAICEARNDQMPVARVGDAAGIKPSRVSQICAGGSQGTG
jgi:hypothetical protein